jgi:hypothetical protein
MKQLQIEEGAATAARRHSCLFLNLQFAIPQFAIRRRIVTLSPFPQKASGLITAKE